MLAFVGVSSGATVLVVDGSFSGAPIMATPFGGRRERLADCIDCSGQSSLAGSVDWLHLCKLLWLTSILLLNE